MKWTCTSSSLVCWSYNLSHSTITTWFLWRMTWHFNYLKTIFCISYLVHVLEYHLNCHRFVHLSHQAHISLYERPAYWFFFLLTKTQLKHSKILLSRKNFRLLFLLPLFFCERIKKHSLQNPLLWNIDYEIYYFTLFQKQT